MSIHFDYRIALKSRNTASIALRLNPGNISNEERIRVVVTVRAKKTFQSVLALTPNSWKKICKKSLANRRRRRCWNPPCAMLIISIA
ncbi:hypothetical protein ACLK19_16655 [Escherichia coli]